MSRIGKLPVAIPSGVTVAVEGNTGFAFDPVSSQELQSGQLAPREFTVMFRHR